MYTMILVYSFLAILLLPTSEQFLDNLEKHLANMKLKVDTVCILAKISEPWELDNLFQQCNVKIQPKLISTLIYQRNPEKTIAHICKMTPCGEIVINRLDPCLTAAQKNYLQNLAALEKAQLDYVCSDNGTVIKIMNGFDQPVCEDNYIPSENCISQMNPSINESEEMFTNKQSCRKLLKSANCLAQEYKYCINKLPYYFVKNVAFYGYNATSCTKYVNGKSAVDLTDLIPKENEQSQENPTSEEIVQPQENPTSEEIVQPQENPTSEEIVQPPENITSPLWQIIFVKIINIF